jgi:lysophospholipase L1-like esterase
MKSFGSWGVVVFFFTVYLGICPSPKGFAQSTPQAYIVLGESTDLGTGATPGNDWVSMFHEFLRTEQGFNSIDLRNYSVFGATMGEIRRDQLAAALSDIASYNSVVLSIGGGGNDLSNFIRSPQGVTCRMVSIQCFARLNALLNNVEVLLDQMVRRLRAATGPNDVILLRTEFNPFLKQGCDNPPGISQLANLALEGSNIVPFLTSGLNDRIRDVAARYDAKVIEIFDLFILNDPNKLVAADCFHANDAGHEVIFEAAKLAFSGQ